MERNRVLVLAALLALAAGGIAVRLVKLQVSGHGFWSAEGVKARSRARRLQAPRGAILDRNGEPLAINEGVYGIQFVYGDFRRRAALGQFQMALFLLSGERPALATLAREITGSLQTLADLRVETILALRPRQRLEDFLFYLGRLTGQTGEKLGARLRADRPDRSLGEVLADLVETARAAVQASVASIEALELLLREGPEPSPGGAAAGGLLAELDATIAAIDKQVAARCVRKTYVEQRVLHRDFDMRDGSWQRDRVPYRVVDELGFSPEHYPGFEIVEQARRVYPAPWRDLAPGLLGFVGATTAADIAVTDAHRQELRELREKDTRTLAEYDRMLQLEVILEEIDYLPGEERGSLGLEALYEPLLRGKRGWRKVARDWASGVRHVVEEKRPIPGHDITLTIDLRVQQAVHDLLARAPDLLRERFSGIGLAVLRLPRGEVLALGSWPQVTRDAYRRAWVDEIEGERKARAEGRFWPGGPVFHRAYNPCAPPPPGSVFKPIVALAALRSGLLDSGFAPFCDGGIGEGNARVHCLGHHGEVRLESALIKSCNAFFAEAARQLGYEPVRRAAESFGLGEPTGFAWARLHPELAGGVATSSGGRPLFSEPACAIAGPTPGLRALRLFGCGQGWIDDTTPLQVARAMGALAIGALPEVHLVKSIEGVALRDLRPRPLPFDEENLARVRHALEQVVGPGGTAHPRGRYDLRRWRVAAKSGSATHGRLKRNGRLLHHAWLAGYCPADAPRLAFAVVVELTLEGGGEAGVKLISELLDDPRLADYLGEAAQ